MPTGQEATKRNGNRRGARGGGGDADVILDVPLLKVEEISLEVDSLHARIALQARLSQLVELNVGADVDIATVALQIKGVEAQAHLEARLDNVLAIVERALQTVDEHPEILVELARSVGEVGESVGDSVGEVGQSLGESVGQLGQSVGQLGQRVLGGGGGGSAAETGQRSGSRQRGGGSGERKPRRRSREARS